MKKHLLLLLILLNPLCSHGQGWSGALSFEGLSLRESGDSLHLAFDLFIHADAVEKSRIVRLTPELTTDRENLLLPHIRIQGKAGRQLYRRWEKTRSKKTLYEAPYMEMNVSRGNDRVFRYTLSIPYQPWMDTARLIIHQESAGYRSESRLLSFTMPHGVELEAREPYQVQILTALIEPEHEAKRRQKQGQAFLDFPSGRSVLLPDYRRNAGELAKIRDAMSEVQQDPDVEIMSLFIEGYASPDGKYATNERLSRERAEALKEYMKSSFSLPESLFRVAYVAEDWEGLKASVQESGLDRKEEILAIIESADDPDTKERKLKAIGGGAPYRRMLQDIFPGLRRVEYQIDYSVQDFTTDQVKALLGRREDMLSHRELYLAALSFGAESPEYEEILTQRILRHFPDDPAALCNAAAVMIGMGETGTARRYLERCSETPAVWNNRAVVLMLEGDLDGAETLLTRAAETGLPQAGHNLRELQTKREDNIKMERYNRR